MVQTFPLIVIFSSSLLALSRGWDLGYQLHAAFVNIYEPLANTISERLLPRQNEETCITVDCAWITDTETCSNVACDCSIVQATGVTGIAACANCLDPINATLAAEAIQVAQLCGVNAATIVTFTVPSTTVFASATATSVNHPLPTLPTSIPSSTLTSSTTYGGTIGSQASALLTATPSTTTPIGNSSPTSSGSSKLSGGAIGGIVGGMVGGFIVLGALVFWWLRRHEMRRSTRGPPVAPAPVQVAGPGVMEEVMPNPVESGLPSGRIKYPEQEDQEDFGRAGARLSRAY